MPPKPKFTREEITAAALKIASDSGMKALTSRALGAALGSSARPIFTVFKSMDEVAAEVHKAAMQKFDSYAEKAEGYFPYLKQIGLQMLLFAKEQPKLYRLLFMSENSQAESFDDIFSGLGKTAVMCIESIQEEHGLTCEQANLLFRHLWIYTYGVGALIATGACHFTENEIQDMLSREFSALLMLIRSGKADSCTIIPQKIL